MIESSAVIDKDPKSALKQGQEPEDTSIKYAVRAENVKFYFGQAQVLKGISVKIRANSVTAFIGPSGCGKSTLLRCVNRMNDLIEGSRLEGHVFLGTTDVYDSSLNTTELRRRVGMVFQKSNPFPKSIYDNVAFGPKIHGMKSGRELDALVEQSLRSVALWDEVAHRLTDSALSLSGGQQQRLCIARAIAVEPEVLLMDEPCSALDPIATSKIEELIFSLKERYTIIIVTHSMQQAARISEFTGFLLHGELIEYGLTKKMFHMPSDKRTEDYIRGRYG